MLLRMFVPLCVLLVIPSTSAEPASVLAMYPFAPLRDSYNTLYGAIASRVNHTIPEVPLHLSWDIDVGVSWKDPELGLGQTCGWPLVTTLRDSVKVIGAFSCAGINQGIPGPFYQSVIIQRVNYTGPLYRAAVNSKSSFSGYISLLEAFNQEKTWDGEVIVTGSHVASINAVRTGQADVASIDGLTWQFQLRDSPSTVAGLHILTHGPVVPCLPLITHGTATTTEVLAWRQTITEVVSHSSLRHVLDVLMISDFQAMDNEFYYTYLKDIQTRQYTS